MLSESRIITQQELPDEVNDTSLRPQTLDEFIGQKHLKSNLKIFIKAAKGRNESLDHVLFYGPPGLGKTTLSQIIAKELSSGFKVTSGPMLTKAGDLAALLTNLKANDILFIDEIHRLNSSVEEVLYSAMEDYCIDLIIGEGPAARTVKINLPKFTLIGATTRLGMLSNPLRDRFGIPLKLEFYTEDELKLVIERASRLLGISFQQTASISLAKSARGTPRVALRLVKRIRDFANNSNVTDVNQELVQHALAALGIDSLGLDNFDYKYLRYINDNYGGGPVGIETIASGLSEDKDTIEDTIEPYLMQIGFIARTPRGRMLTQNAIQYIMQ